MSQERPSRGQAPETRRWAGDALLASTALATCVAIVGCGRVGFDPVAFPADSGAGDTGMDTATADSGARDSGVDARDAATDTGRATDSGTDASTDAAADTGAADAGCGPATPSTIVAHYPFEGSADDVVGGQHGTASGGPSYVAGRVGQAASFDGVDAVVQLPSFVMGNVSHSVSFWVNTTVSAPGGPASLWTNGMSLVDGEVCGIPPTSDWGMALIDGGHVAIYSSHSDREINDGTWHQVLYVSNAATNDLAVYIDGVIEIELDRVLATATFDDVPWVGVGNSPCPSNYLQGLVDEVVFYNRAFDPAEAAEIFACVPASTVPIPEG